MYCPLCSKGLHFRKNNPGERPKDPTYDNDETDKDREKIWEAQKKYNDPNLKPESFECFSCGINYVFHNPYRGIESTPTDNWSLSYLK